MKANTAARRHRASSISCNKSFMDLLMNRCYSAVVMAALLSVLTVGQTCLADDKPGVETQFYLGESKMTTPDGKLVRTSLSLVKRVLNPAQNRIEEHVLSIGEKEAKAFVVLMEVKGKTFTMTERSQSFTGAGELVGEAWKWNEWKSVSKLPGGAGTTTSEDRLTEKGLSAKKTYAGPDGKVVLHFEESLAPISAKTYEILYARLAPAEKR